MNDRKRVGKALQHGIHRSPFLIADTKQNQHAQHDEIEE